MTSSYNETRNAYLPWYKRSYGGLTYLEILLFFVSVFILIGVIVWLSIVSSNSVPARPANGPTGTVQGVPPNNSYVLTNNSGSTTNNVYIQAFGGSMLGITGGATGETAYMAFYSPATVPLPAYEHFHITTGDDILGCPNSVYLGTTPGGTCMFLSPGPTFAVECQACASNVGITGANWFMSSDAIGQSQGSIRIQNCLGGQYLTSNVNSAQVPVTFNAPITGQNTSADFFAWT